MHAGQSVPRSYAQMLDLLRETLDSATDTSDKNCWLQNPSGWGASPIDDASELSYALGEHLWVNYACADCQHRKQNHGVVVGKSRDIGHFSEGGSY